MDLNYLINNLQQSSNKIVYYEAGLRKEKLFKDVYLDVVKVASFLKEKSIQRGDRVGILSKNCYQWVVIDLACLSCGFITVPLEPNHLTEVDELSKEYGLSAVVTSSKSNFWHSPDIISFDQVFTYTGCSPLIPVTFKDEDIFTFNFTSGTSGRPKAIELKKGSFDNLVTESQKLFNFGKEDRFLVFLPLTVYLERCYIYSAILIGFDIILVGAELVFKIMQAEAPTVIIGVPYFFESIQKAFLMKISSRPVFDFIFKAYTKLTRMGCGFLFGHKFFPFTKFWGGKMKYLLCGSAPIKRNTLDFYSLMGIEIYEGYGMNEIGGMISLNYPGNRKSGSVGKIFPGKTITFDNAGQIIIQSRYNGNCRYFNTEDSGGTYLDNNRVATGDIGHIDADGYVYITGRIKDIIIFSNGVKTHPAPLEEKLEEELPIKNCCVFGEGKPFLTALIVPTDPEASWDQINDKLQKCNGNLPLENQIRNFFISREPFTIDNGLLTPAFKRNRKYLYLKYALEFDKLY